MPVLPRLVQPLRSYSSLKSTRFATCHHLSFGHHSSSKLALRRYASWNLPTNVSPGPNLPGPDDEEPPRSKGESTEWRQTLSKMFESAVTTLVSIGVLGLFGYSYTRYYKYHVLKKMENAFMPGDPVLALANAKLTFNDPSKRPYERDEQALLDSIVNGTRSGNYFLLVGEKGTGKSSMLIEAMSKIDGEGVSMFDAHANLEIFRIRLGKALDFEYHEDNIGSLFSIRGPRDASALLDIERALNKLEKVALNRRRKTGRPLILIINSTHLVRDDDDGRDLLELIQQRAEQWAAGRLCTVIMNSDDYWVYERLKVQATRLEVIPILDLTKDKAIAALKAYRGLHEGKVPTEAELEQVYDRIGGRPNFLKRVATCKDMQKACDDICQMEKTWFLNKCWILGEEMDDDVMDQQKYASAAMVLAKALVNKAKEMNKTYDSHKGHILPEIPLHEARQIMTRADFIQGYDQVNLFAIDSRAMVRADSVPMQRAFEEICTKDGFDQYLQDTLDRISAIESLGRTRELTLKDLWNKGQYEIQTKGTTGEPKASIIFQVVPKEDESNDNDDSNDDEADGESPVEVGPGT